MNEQMMRDLKTVCTVTPYLGYGIWTQIKWDNKSGLVKNLDDLDKVFMVSKRRKKLLIDGYNKLIKQNKGK